MYNINNKNFVNIIIDDITLLVNKNTTIIQACLILKKKLKKSDDENEIDIPRFCFHQELEIAGNCRMCLVELVKSPKPVVACAMQINDNMIIKTDTVLVKKAREGVLEFFLINHPLDCPVCDQGGECDLQDQIDVFGIDKSRFNEYKRAISYKTCGHFIKMIMTRCIHCTRCIRFLTDIAGIYTFCLTGRGNMMEVGSFILKNLKSELSGNIVDLCPVGALTSKATTYKLRYWELNKKETIDILDNIGADIRVDLRGTEIMRILPRLNKDVNNNWITDLTRYSFDALVLQRFSLPYYRKDIKDNKNNLLFKTNWDDILEKIWKHYFINKIILKKQINFSFYSGGASDIYTSLSIKKLSNSFGSSFHEGRFENNNLNIDFRSNYLLNLNKINFNDINVLILLGLNLRLEAPLFNLKIRKLKKKKNFLIIAFSSTINLLYYVKHIAINIKNFLKFLEGKHFLTNYILNNIDKNNGGIDCDNNNTSLFYMLGSSILRRKDNIAYINAISYYIHLYNRKSSYGIVQTNIGRITSSEIGLSSGVSYFNDTSLFKNNNSLFKNSLNYLFLFSTDDYKNIISKLKRKNIFNIYVGSQSFELSNFMHIILPVTSHFEKIAYYLNLEGVVRQGQEIIKVLEQTQYDWRISFLIYLKINKSLNYIQYFNKYIFNNLLNINYLYINYFFNLKKEKWLYNLNFFLSKYNENNLKIKLKNKKIKKKNNLIKNLSYIYFIIYNLNNKLFSYYIKNKIIKFYINYFSEKKKKILFILMLLYKYKKYLNYFLLFIKKIEIINAKELNLEKDINILNDTEINIKILENIRKQKKNKIINKFITILLHSIINIYLFNINYFFLNHKQIDNNFIFNILKNNLYLEKNNILNFNKLKFNKLFFNFNIFEKSSLFFDKKIILNYIYRFYFINTFSIITKNLYNIKKINFFNKNLLQFLLILFINNLYNYNINKEFIFIFINKFVKLNYIEFNKIFINFYFSEFRYSLFQNNSLFFADNIEEKLFSDLKMYTRLFLNSNQYYCLYNKTYNIFFLNKYYLKKKKVNFNNYPINSYIDNYFNNNILSSLSLRIKTVTNKTKYKLLFSNYL